MAWILNLFLRWKNVYVDTVDMYADRVHVPIFLPAVPIKFLIIIDSGLIFLNIKEKCQIFSRRSCMARKAEKLRSLAVASAVLPVFFWVCHSASPSSCLCVKVVLDSEVMVRSQSAHMPRL